MFIRNRKHHRVDRTLNKSITLSPEPPSLYRFQLMEMHASRPRSELMICKQRKQALHNLQCASSCSIVGLSSHSQSATVVRNVSRRKRRSTMGAVSMRSGSNIARSSDTLKVVRMRRTVRSSRSLTYGGGGSSVFRRGKMFILLR